MTGRSSELDHIGIHSANIVINATLPKTAGTEPLAVAVLAREKDALAHLAPALTGLPLDQLSLKSGNVMGLTALRALFCADVVDTDQHTPATHFHEEPSLVSLIDQIEADSHALVMCMGKGGVGKTTIAAAIAVALAQRGHPVHQTTTDPAAHLEQTLQGSLANLQVTRIDPVQATQEYRDHVMASKGSSLDDAGRANLTEDLLSPCTEEVAVFRQFSSLIREGRKGYVIVDTAPTGHTLLLLDAAGSYHRDMVRQMGESTGFTTPMMMLQDPGLTKIILVTLPEKTPVLEASILQADLKRAGIATWAWVINASISAAHPSLEFLRMRAASETEPIEMVSTLASRLAVVPLQTNEPVGIYALAELTQAPELRGTNQPAATSAT
jgi:arsenite/tail-anchored protein-transporting ATPase